MSCACCSHDTVRVDLEGGIDVAYSTYGDARLPAVLVLGGISAHGSLIECEHAAHSGWWPGIVGAGHALDPLRNRLIGIDYVGGRGASAWCDETRRRPLTTLEHARIAEAVLDAIAIDVCDVVGASFGGMIALVLCAAAPQRIRRGIIIAAAARSDPMASAGRTLQRRVVELGVANGTRTDALAIARGIAVTSYRSAREFRERFTEPAAVAGYLSHQGRRFADSFTCDGYLDLSHALDTHCIDPSEIATTLTLIGFDSDALVPHHQITALARSAPQARAVILPSRYGHDGFLKEHVALAPLIARALGGESREESRTTAIRAGVASDTQYGAVIPPLHLSTTFTFEEFGRARRYDYTRSGNPTRDILAEAIAELECGVGGIVTATGMAAVLLPLQLLQPGDVLIAPHDCYGGTHRLLTGLSRKGQFEVAFIDLTDTGQACSQITRIRPRAVWVESPSNPLLRITDIVAIADAARGIGALSIVDNTFLSPALQQPLRLGADIVVHSTTKYINGHSDVVGGAVVARDPAVHAELAWWANCLGITGSPFDAWLTLRGLRTLHVRTAAQQESASTIARSVATHPSVRHVHYPGLPTHSGADIASRQQKGAGAMLSVELNGGVSAARSVVERLRYFTLAESLGGVESLVAHPATMTHASMPADARLAAGITDGLLRFSVGLEETGDLLDDVTCALDSLLALVPARA